MTTKPAKKNNKKKRGATTAKRRGARSSPDSVAPRPRKIPRTQKTVGRTPKGKESILCAKCPRRGATFHCDRCNIWFHLKCIKKTRKTFRNKCPDCEVESGWEDKCHKCGSVGDLLCCGHKDGQSHCHKALHAACAGLAHTPAARFYCMGCLQKQNCAMCHEKISSYASHIQCGTELEESEAERGCFRSFHTRCVGLDSAPTEWFCGECSGEDSE